MSISSTSRKAGPFTGDGSNDEFPFTFKVFATSDVQVVSTDLVGAETTLTMGADYTVSLNADQDVSPGGTVTTTTAPAVDFLITLTSAVPALQAVQIPNQGGFYPAVLNGALDRLTILVQQVLEQVNRSIKVGISSSATPDELVATLTTNASAAVSAASSAAGSATAASISAATAAAAAASVGFTSADLEKQTYTAFTTGGSAPNFTLAPSPAIGALTAGVRFRVKFSAAGSGSDTLNISTLGAKNLKQYDSSGAKVAAVIASGQLADVEYDGTDCVVLDPLPAPSPSVSPSVRQTVQYGAINSSGSASMFSAGSGLALNLSATAKALRIAFAAGVQDYTSTLTADVTGAITLPASNASFISADYVSGSSATWGSTLAPVQYGYTYSKNLQSCLSLNNISTDDFGNTWTNTAVTFTNTSPIIAGTYMGVFNGTTAYLRTTDITSLGNAGWTIRGKFKINNVAAGQNLFCAGTSAANWGVQLLTSGSKLMIFASSNGSSWDISGGTAGNTTLVNGTAYDIEVCYDAVAGKYFTYLNGVAEGLMTIATASKICSFSNITVGASSLTTAASFFGGNIQGFEVLPYCAHPNGVSFTPSSALASVAAQGYSSDFFSIPDMTMYQVSAASTTAGTNPTFTAKNRVYVCEAVTGASTVSSVTNYALNGRYDSGWTSTLPSIATKTSKNHNLGVVPEAYDLIIECLSTELGIAVGERLHSASLAGQDGTVRYPPNMYASRLSMALQTAGNTAFMALNASGVGTALTAASWKYKFLASRGW